MMKTMTWMAMVCLIMSFLLTTSGWAQESACPSWCLPQSLVKTRQEPSGEAGRPCPEGCVPISDVAEVQASGKPSGDKEPIIEEVEQDELDRELEEDASERALSRDPSPHRLVFTRTGRVLPEGEQLINSYWAGLWRYAYGVNDNIEIGLLWSLPTVIMGAMTYVTFAGEVAKDLHLSISPQFGGWVMFIGGSGGFFAGGSTALTYGDDAAMFNLSFSGYYGGVGSDGIGYSDFSAFLPSIGAKFRLTDMVLLNLEFSMVGLPDLPEEMGKIWAFMYGFRIHGEGLFGDISFVMPFFDHFWEIQKYCPIGYPLVNLGYRW